MKNHAAPFVEARLEWERTFLIKALRMHRGNQCRTAQALGIHRNTMTRKLIECGVTDQELHKIRRSA